VSHRLKHLQIWVVPIVTFAIGNLSGAYWHSLNYNLEKVRVANEMYAELKSIRSDVEDKLPEYLSRRDRFIRTNDRFRDAVPSPAAHDEIYGLQNSYNSSRSHLAIQVTQYNRTEALLARLEGRAPQWFIPDLPPPPATQLRAVTSTEGKQMLTYRAPDLDPVLVEIYRRLPTAPKSEK
jgi:hypothetical protein